MSVFTCEDNLFATNSVLVSKETFLDSVSVLDV